MADMQEFPENWEDFIKMYEFDDSAEVYTNGVMLVPSFRVGQMIEHYFKERTCESVNVNGYAFRFECSSCGYVAIVHNCEIRLDELPNYCPNCGAKVVSE